MFNITDFRSNLNSKGVLRSNKYIVSFKKPNYLSGLDFGDTDQLISLRCENASLPGFSFASADGPPRFGYGPIEKHPYVPTFEGLSLTFLMDSNAALYNFFDCWCSVIVNNISEGGTKIRNNWSYPNDTNKYKFASYEVGYKADYQTDLIIDVYDGTSSDDSKAGKKIFGLIAYSAFPMGLPSIPLAWDSTDVIRLTIPFTYTDFSIKY